MNRSDVRYQEGRNARIQAEILMATANKSIAFKCIYKRPEQLKQYRRGWDNVTEVDIKTAILRATQNAASNKRAHHV
ncbi:hypothetical protein [Cognaticolwellia mytili]|uniref:hypothetical protein n=1 Tax=Cognaticolwellia mytili TaxID=1888913 RepID=UPI000A17751E|nr:hypothetical protein [Cognaticolwellia mytili]